MLNIASPVFPSKYIAIGAPGLVPSKSSGLDSSLWLLNQKLAILAFSASNNSVATDLKLAPKFSQ